MFSCLFPLLMFFLFYFFFDFLFFYILLFKSFLKYCSQINLDNHDQPRFLNGNSDYKCYQNAITYVLIGQVLSTLSVFRHSFYLILSYLHLFLFYIYFVNFIYYYYFYNREYQSSITERNKGFMGQPIPIIERSFGPPILLPPTPSFLSLPP